MSSSVSNPQDEASGWADGLWKRPLLIVFHASVALTYGFALVVMNLPSGRHVDPVMEPYGKWRFLTYNDLVLQFVTFSVCLATHFLPQLTRVKDFLFTSLAFPVGLFVVGCFWGVWFIAGRENILPVESGVPSWLNHISHTIMLPINLTQMVLVEHNHETDKRAIASLLIYLMAYNSYLLFIRFRTGQFVYVFMNKMSSTWIGVFIICMVALTVSIYKVGKVLHDYAHRQESYPPGGTNSSGIDAHREFGSGRSATNGAAAPKGSSSNGLTLSIIEST